MGTVFFVRCAGTLPVLYDSGPNFPKSEALALSCLQLFDALLRGNLDPLDFPSSLTSGASCAAAVLGIMARFPGRYVALCTRIYRTPWLMQLTVSCTSLVVGRRLDIQLLASNVLCGLLASEASINEVVAAGGIAVLTAALKLGLKSSKKLMLSLYATLLLLKLYGVGWGGLLGAGVLIFLLPPFPTSPHVHPRMVDARGFGCSLAIASPQWQAAPLLNHRHGSWPPCDRHE